MQGRANVGGHGFATNFLRGEDQSLVMSIDDETQVRPRFWIGIVFILIGVLQICFLSSSSSGWEAALLILLGVAIFSYHIAKYVVPF